MKNKKIILLAKTTLFLGIFLAILIYLAETILFNSSTLERNLPIKLSIGILIYLSAALYFLVKEKSPLKKSFSYLKQSLNYIYIIFFIFLLGSLIGFFFSPYLTFLEQILKEIVEKTKNLNSLELIIFILLNNTLASLISLIGGIILGLMPLFSSLGNGVILGYVLNKAGIFSFWRLLPHGVFELPAIFISFGLGIKLGFFIFEKNKFENLKQRDYSSFLVLIFIIIPLLVIAALIEGILISFFA